LSSESRKRASACPALEEALANIRVAIREYLEARDAVVKDEETREVEVLV
jgi:hypothetical protein